MLDIEAILAFAGNGPPPAAPAAPRARLLLLDCLGCAIAGLRHPRAAGFATALAITMPGPYRLPGTAPGLSEAGLAAALAAAMCWDEANEGLARAHGRPALAVAPIILAALLGGRVRLGEARAAFALGYEVAGRAGEIWRIRPGMHVDGSWHALGAAAAAARLMGGDAPAIARAVRLAACQIPFTLYAPIAAGMDGRNSYAAHAALLGQMAASAALAGMDGPTEGLAEARRLALLDDSEPSPSAPGTWLLAEAYIKPYAGVRHAHYAAAAALALRPRLGDAPGAIATLRLATYDEALRYAANRAPASAIAAQFSLSWAIAAALVQGDLGPEAYTEAALADPRLHALEARVVLVEDEALSVAGQRGASLTILRADGEPLTARIDQVPGDPEAPLGRDAVLAKFFRYAGGGQAPLARALLDGNDEALLPPIAG